MAVSCSEAGFCSKSIRRGEKMVNKAKIAWLRRAIAKEENLEVRAMIIYQILKEAKEE